MNETTFEDLDQAIGKVGDGQPPVGSKPAKPLGRTGMIILCAGIMFAGLFCTYAAFMVASNPEESFSTLSKNQENFIYRTPTDMGEARLTDLAIPVLVMSFSMACLVIIYNRREARDDDPFVLFVPWFLSGALLILIIACFFIVGGVLHHALVQQPVLRIIIYTSPFLYFIAVMGTRSSGRGMKAFACGLFFLWLSMGFALDLPPPSVGKVLYCTFGWLALSLLVPYGLWGTKFPAPEDAAKRPGPLQREFWTGDKSYREVFAGLAAIGLIIVLPTILVPLATSDPELKDQGATLVPDPNSSARPSPNETEMQWYYANITFANISLTIINYGGAPAEGIYIDFFGQNESENNWSLLRHAGPVSVGGYSKSSFTYSVKYYRFVIANLTFNSQNIGQAAFDFEPKPSNPQDECVIALFMPVATIFSYLLKSGKDGQRPKRGHKYLGHVSR